MKTSILGVGIDDLRQADIRPALLSMLTGHTACQIVTVNPEFIMEAQHHPRFRDILQRADLAVADGIGVLFASYYLGTPLPGRITGVDLLWTICWLAAERGERIFLLGGKYGVAHETAKKLTDAIPGLRIVGADSGERHWWKLPDRHLREKIDRTHPTILFVAYGAPKQELWIARNAHKLHSVRIAMGVGGAFDFVSGTVRRAPRMFQILGLEWLWRLLLQPWRAQRILTATWHFSRAVMQQKAVSTPRQRRSWGGGKKSL